jgi:hypothetical protein
MEADGTFDMVVIGQTDLGSCSGDSDGADEQAHRPLLASEDMIDRRAHSRFAGIGPGGSARHRLAHGFLAVDLRARQAAGEEPLVRPGAISGVGPHIAGGVVRVDQFRQQCSVVARRVVARARCLL